MTKLININVNDTVNGGAAYGLMTSAGNPWPVADGFADELVNRKRASYVDVSVPVLESAFVKRRGSKATLVDQYGVGLLANAPAANLLSQGAVETFRTAVIANGGTISDSHLDALRRPLDTLIRSSAWPKIRWMWLPLGNELAGALTVLKKPSALSATLTGVNLVSGDYDPRKGITGNTSSKLINTDFNPSAQGMTLGEQGFAICAASGGVTGYTDGSTLTGAGWPASPAGVLGGSITGGTGAGSYFLGHSTLNRPMMCGDAGGSQYALFPSLTQRPYGRLLSVQVTSVGGVQKIQARRQGTLLGSVTASGLVQASGNIQLLGIGNGSFCPATVTGAAYFDALTDAEFVALSAFFDSVNAAVGRAFNPTLGVSGDSIAGGTTSPVGPTTRWSKLVADKLGLIEDNKGIAGARILNTGAPAGSLAFNRQAYVNGLNACRTMIAFGINDLCQAAGDRSVMQAAINAYDIAVGEFVSSGYDMDRCLIIAPAYVDYAMMIVGFPSYAGYTVPDHIWFNAQIIDIGRAAGARTLDMRDVNVSTYAAAVASAPATYTIEGLHPNIAGNVLYGNDVYGAQVA